MNKEDYSCELESVDLDAIKLILGDKYEKWKKYVDEIQMVSLLCDIRLKEFNDAIKEGNFQKAENKWVGVNTYMRRQLALRLKIEENFF